MRGQIRVGSGRGSGEEERDSVIGGRRGERADEAALAANWHDRPFRLSHTPSAAFSLSAS